ncbi:DNA polymerase III subunit beta [Rhizobacter sp. P5_C2]
MIVLKETQAKLLAALQAVCGIVERRHTLPILANVLIRKTGSSIAFTTSDLDIEVGHQAELGGDAGDFATTVSARKLVDILKAMPPDQVVTLTAEPGRLRLQGGRSRFMLHTLPAEQFPLVARAPHATTLQLPQGVLKSLVDQVSFAMATHDIRYFLNGMLFATDGRRVRLVATDGNRLALAEASVDADLPTQQVIVPRKAVHELQRHLREGRDDEASVEIRLAPAQASFELNGIGFVTKLIEGRFPDFERAIPKANPHAVTLGRAALLECLQRASLMTSDKFRGIRLSFAPGALRIVSSNAEREEADEDLDIDYGGVPLEIGFNVTYLTEVLGETDAEMVTMALQDAGSAVLFTFPQRSGFKYVVSPMRL